MSTAKMSIYRAVRKNSELRIWLTDDENYQFGTNYVCCPVHVEFTDDDEYPYKGETAHHARKSNEVELVVDNSRHECEGWMPGLKKFSFRCDMRNLMDFPRKNDGKQYYAFLEAYLPPMGTRVPLIGTFIN